MNNKFDELTKGLAQSVTRRAALKKFGVGLAGVALAALGLANKAEAGPNPCRGPGALCGVPNQLKQSHKMCPQQCCSGRYVCRSTGFGFSCACL